MSDFPWQKFLAPRFWPSWIGLALLRVSIYLPYPLLMRAGQSIGLLLFYFMPYRRRIALHNIRLCFPHLSDEKQFQLVKENFVSIGQSLLETAFSWWGKLPDNQWPTVRIEGLQHLKNALAAQKGVILLSAHFSCLEIGARFLLQKQPLVAFAQEVRNPLFHAVMLRARSRKLDLLLRDDVRGMIRALRNNAVIWYAMDQDYGQKGSVFSPFFNIDAATLCSTSRLARATDCRVMPFYTHRLKNGQGYRIALLPSLKNFPADSCLQDNTRIHQLIEKQINQYPEQYLWLHRRFKTRPAGKVSPYPAKQRRIRRYHQAEAGVRYNFYNRSVLDLLKANQLQSFEDFWSLHLPWVEAPNKRRGGYSGVVRHELQYAQNRIHVFIKRQENHNTFSLRHPWRGIPTFEREYRNIAYLQARAIPAIDCLYYAQRLQNNNLQAILVTFSIEDSHRTLKEMILDEDTSAEHKDRALYASGYYMARLHSFHIKHGCFFPTHIFVNKTFHERLDIRLIDLERMKRWQTIRSASRNDLRQFFRRAEMFSSLQIDRFIEGYSDFFPDKKALHRIAREQKERYWQG